MATGSFQATPSDDRGRRAFRPGARWAFVAAVVAALAVAAVLVLALKPGSAGKVSAQHRGLSSLPSWLPKSARDPAADKPAFEVATPAKPILDEEQGYTVVAKLPGGSAEVTANGPLVPSYVSQYAQSGTWPAGKLAPATFYVTFADVKGTIPVSAKAFSVATDGGETLSGKLHVKGGGALPAAIHAGQTITLELKSRALEGQGAITWTPTGGKALVAWIYQLELD